MKANPEGIWEVWSEVLFAECSRSYVQTLARILIFFKSKPQTDFLSFSNLSFQAFSFPHLYFLWNPFSNLLAFVSTYSAYFCSGVWNFPHLFHPGSPTKTVPFQHTHSRLLFIQDWNKAKRLLFYIYFKANFISCGTLESIGRQCKQSVECCRSYMWIIRSIFFDKTSFDEGMVTIIRS